MLSNRLFLMAADFLLRNGIKAKGFQSFLGTLRRVGMTFFPCCVLQPFVIPFPDIVNVADSEIRTNLRRRYVMNHRLASEQLAVRTEACQPQSLIVGLFIDQEKVGFDVAFSASIPLAGKLVILIPCRERRIGDQQRNYILE